MNKLLNETRGGVPQGEGHEEYPTMGGKTYDSNSLAGMMGMGNGEPNVAETTRGTRGGVADEGLSKVLNKDYRAVMKAIDKKKQGGGPLIP